MDRSSSSEVDSVTWERVDDDYYETVDSDESFVLKRPELKGEFAVEYYNIFGDDDECSDWTAQRDDTGGSSERSGGRAWDNGHNS